MESYASSSSSDSTSTGEMEVDKGDQKGPSMILQAVASYDLWIWNAYFGSVGTNNDINVLEASPIIEDCVAGIERPFGVLKKRWHFVSNPCRLGSKEKMTYVMYACLILHNMILKDDDKAYCQDYSPGYVEPERERISMEERITNSNFIRQKEAQYALTTDLIEHCWFNRRVTRDD
ncbi:hypothetical protein QVD17_39350 [Tagetes erecta]|uniref:DDE Tnp4 domain-containing protein n=1 Tax=Tagetes erecta TaxID=13708 RepID=A0AAD8JS70_TARER|nr:hypothetical protein QVD17_39350 [Tagetes erecta]